MWRKSHYFTPCSHSSSPLLAPIFFLFLPRKEIGFLRHCQIHPLLPPPNRFPQQPKEGWLAEESLCGSAAVTSTTSWYGTRYGTDGPKSRKEPCAAAVAAAAAPAGGERWWWYGGRGDEQTTHTHTHTHTVARNKNRLCSKTCGIDNIFYWKIIM